MQDNNETSIREPTVQRAEQDGELARVEHRGSSAWVGSNRGPTEPNSVDFTPSSRPLPTKTEKAADGRRSIHRLLRRYE